jgi:hypothetical protein
MDIKTTKERLERLKRDADNKKLVIKNLKLTLERLDITEYDCKPFIPSIVKSFYNGTLKQ